MSTILKIFSKSFAARKMRSDAEKDLFLRRAYHVHKWAKGSIKQLQIKSVRNYFKNYIVPFKGYNKAIDEAINALEMEIVKSEALIDSKSIKKSLYTPPSYHTNN